MNTEELKQHIKGVVTFEFYRAKELWYKTEDGFLFPVPIEDVGDATFLNQDKGILFMRYIRKYMIALAEDQTHISP